MSNLLEETAVRLCETNSNSCPPENLQKPLKIQGDHKEGGSNLGLDKAEDDELDKEEPSGSSSREDLPHPPTPMARENDARLSFPTGTLVTTMNLQSSSMVDLKAELDRNKRHGKGKRFQSEEDKRLLDAVERFRIENGGKNNVKGINWDVIMKMADLYRTKDQIQRRYRILTGKRSLSSSATMTTSDDVPTPPYKKKKTSELDESIDVDGSVDVDNQVTLSPCQPPSSNGGQLSTATVSTSARGSYAISSVPLVDAGVQTEGTLFVDTLQQLDNAKRQMEENERTYSDHLDRMRAALIGFVRSQAELEREQHRAEVRGKTFTLGSPVYTFRGAEILEEWQEGSDFLELNHKLKMNAVERVKIEVEKNNLQIERAKIKKSINAATASSSSTAFSEQQQQQLQDELLLKNIADREDYTKNQLAKLKVVETSIRDERDRKLIDLRKLIKEVKLDKEEQKSKFNDFPILNERYLLTKLLGKGGFSEVYKAYDLQKQIFVACKIHQLNESWKDEKKAAYIKHVLRECAIHRTLEHPNIVKIIDTFSKDDNTIVAVMQYGDCVDLDCYLKINQYIPEREAKTIISQVLAGLKYLSDQKPKIIHYDLKPGNILLYGECVKITDFGLSKEMTTDDDVIELTSQGSGTYWYLPPECFVMSDERPPTISTKVDVWSAGVVLYQMLFGQKPFGNDLSQQKILRQGIISASSFVSFPNKPIVSEEAKKFIQKLLEPNKDLRPEVGTVYNDSFLQRK